MRTPQPSNLESRDNTIYSGTVADAHAAGKSRLTLQVEQEIRQCCLDASAVDEPEDSTDELTDEDDESTEDDADE